MTCRPSHLGPTRRQLMRSTWDLEMGFGLSHSLTLSSFSCHLECPLGGVQPHQPALAFAYLTPPANLSNPCPSDHFSHRPSCLRMEQDPLLERSGLPEQGASSHAALWGLSCTQGRQPRLTVEPPGLPPVQLAASTGTEA